MMRLDSLAVRIGLLFLAGLIALLLALALVVAWPGGPGRPVFSLVGPDDAAAMAEVLEAAPPDLRPALLQALSLDATIVRLEPAWTPESDEGAIRSAPRLQRRFAPYAVALNGRPFRVQTRRGAHVQMLRNGGVVAAAPVRLLVELRTGQVMVIERTPPAAVRRVVHRGVLLAAVTVAILLVMLIVAVRQTARPVSRLAGDARRLATDLTTPDVPERGAAEIKALATAFNHMKRTIRGLMDERTRMLAAIAHDMRTYLTRLRLRADFIGDPDQRARAIADLEEMNLLLDDTLTFARETTTIPHVARDVIEIAAELSAFVALRRELGQPVTLEATGVSPFARCSPLALRRMLANLTDNALRYGGAASLNLRVEDKSVAIEISDDGPGVPPEALARLTDPFERLEPSRGRRTGGAGLGLAIVKALAESQGGSLSLENRLSGGLRATLVLPAVSASHGS